MCASFLLAAHGFSCKRSGLYCLGKDAPHAPPSRSDQRVHRRQKKMKESPPQTLLPLDPPLHLADYEAMSKEGRSESKEPEQVETSRSQTGVKRIN
ncbi:hypothetical protein AMECASPLE_007910 [Ameca splendens]|uniref:Uncharacterized protein n=1 Tax=Ameca splendens TaxID=208324 RepID=A0ABV0ZJT8_9TELE